MGFDNEEWTECPRCGKRVPTGNRFCGFCGASVLQVRRSSTIEPVSSSQTTQRIPPYERKFSTFERVMKLISSPKEVMEDIGLAPDYSGVLVIFSLWSIVSIIGLALALPKIQFTGPYGNTVNSMLATAMVGVAIFLPFGLIIRWLVKSYLVRHGCDGNAWDFTTAASVTGYAYLPNAILGLVGVIVSWMVIPSVVIDTTDVTQALVQIQQFNAEILWISIGISIVLSLIALFWKSQLGSYGAHAGTHRRVGQSSAYGTFMMIGLLGILIDFVSNFL
jgi:hypothetical protein